MLTYSMKLAIWEARKEQLYHEYIEYVSSEVDTLYLQLEADLKELREEYSMYGDSYEMEYDRIWDELYDELRRLYYTAEARGCKVRDLKRIFDLQILGI